MKSKTQKIVLFLLLLSWAMIPVIILLFSSKNDDDWGPTMLLMFWIGVIAISHITALVFFIKTALSNHHKKGGQNRITVTTLVYLAFLIVLFSLFVGPLDFLRGVVEIIYFVILVLKDILTLGRG